MSDVIYDAAIIGSGPGGYVAAIRCSQLGLKTAVIEKNKTFGGTCLNVGCIPSKALLDSTDLLVAARERMKNHGIMTDGLKIDLAQMMKRKNDIVGRITGGVKSLLASYKVDTYEGTGRLNNNHSVSVENAEGRRTEIRAKNIILAAGSIPMELKDLPFDHDKIIDSTDALSLSDIPQRMVIVGAGAIGLEMGSIWSRLGTEVTIVEMMDQVLPYSDSASALRLFRILGKQGIDIRISTKVLSADRAGDKLKLILEDKEKNRSGLTCDKLLVAAGRKPCIEGLGLDEAGVEYDHRTLRIKTGKKYESSVPGIYAIGDIIEGPMLAHKAEEEGIAVSEIIAKGFGEVNYGAIPSVVYTWPEYASVGKSEDELKKDGVQYNTGVFNFRPNGRALASDNLEGFVKIYSDKKTDRLLGAQIIGGWASDLICEVVTVMEFGGTSEDIARTVHAHPALSEVVREAAMDVEGWSIHSLAKLKK